MKQKESANLEPHSEPHLISPDDPLRRWVNHAETKVLFNTSTSGQMCAFPFWKLCFQFCVLQTTSAHCSSPHSFISSLLLKWPMVLLPRHRLWAFGHCVPPSFPWLIHSSRQGLFVSPSFIINSLRFHCFCLPTMPISHSLLWPVSQMDHRREGRRT